MVFTPARRYLHERLVLGRRRTGAPDFPAKFPLAGAPRLHLLPLPPAHSCARRGRRPRRGLPERPVPDLCQPVCHAAVARRADRLPAQPPLPHAGLDVPDSTALFFFAKGRDYYMAAAYPMLLAMGAAAGERWIAHPAKAGPLGRRNRLLRRPRILRSLHLRCGSAPLCRWPAQATLRSTETATCAKRSAGPRWSIRSPASAIPCPPISALTLASLSATTERLAPSKCSALPINYLRRSARPTPSGYRGYPTPPPTTIILLGNSRERADELFTNCRLAGHNGNPDRVRNEESIDHPDIFVCGPPRISWQEMWQKVRDFG